MKNYFKNAFNLAMNWLRLEAPFKINNLSLLNFRMYMKSHSLALPPSVMNFLHSRSKTITHSHIKQRLLKILTKRINKQRTLTMTSRSMQSMKCKDCYLHPQLKEAKCWRQLPSKTRLLLDLRTDNKLFNILDEPQTTTLAGGNSSLALAKKSPIPNF